MTLRLTAIAALFALMFAGVSCDSHSWEETRVLHGHGEKHGAAGHGEEDSHGKPGEGHGEGAAKKDH